MSKYKLIKKYPGSPEIGDVVEYHEGTFPEYFVTSGSGRYIGCRYTKKMVEEYPEFWEEIKEIQMKTLKDYEDILLTKSGAVMVGGNTVSYRTFYEHLRQNEPRLYWSKIFRIIADDLNNKDITPNMDRYYISWDYHSSNKYNINVHVAHLNGAITYFTSKENAEKAMKILGEINLDKIFK